METVEDRVRRSLERIGLSTLEVTDLGEGRIRVKGEMSSDEATLIQAATNSVRGVQKVTVEMKR